MKKNDTLWDNLRQGLRDGLQFTVKKTERLTRIGRLKLDILSVRRQMDRKHAELGVLVFEQVRDADESSLWMDVNMLDAVHVLRGLEQRLHQLEDDLEVASSEVDEPGVEDELDEDSARDSRVDAEFSVLEDDDDGPFRGFHPADEVREAGKGQDSPRG